MRDGGQRLRAAARLREVTKSGNGFARKGDAMTWPWKWSESGLQLLDDGGRAVLSIRPSDATEEEFDLIEAAPELLECLVQMMLEARMHPTGVQDSTANKAQNLAARITKGKRQ
jgi:hypothetical protein